MSTNELRQAAERGWAEAVRTEAAPTVAYFEQLLARHPDSALALYHCARANDYAGNPAVAAPLYERAFAAGLPDPELRRGLTSYGSTLRNLDRPAEAVAVLERAAAAYPRDALVRCYLALALHSDSRSPQALATMLELVLGTLADPELQANRWALSNYAAALRTGRWTPTGGAALHIPVPEGCAG